MDGAKETVENAPEIQNSDAKRARLFWKGKRVSRKVYNKRCQQQAWGAKIREAYCSGANGNPNLEDDSDVSADEASYKFMEIEGRRIVHIKTLDEQLICTKCNSVLSLLDIKQERRCGLVSTFYIECRQCKWITGACTDKRHVASSGKQHFDTNTKIAIGTLNSGIGNTHVNKLLASLNIPEFNWNTYKTHEKEVGKFVQQMAQETCVRAAFEEREKTIENCEKMNQLL